MSFNWCDPYFKIYKIHVYKWMNGIVINFHLNLNILSDTAPVHQDLLRCSFVEFENSYILSVSLNSTTLSFKELILFKGLFH